MLNQHPALPESASLAATPLTLDHAHLFLRTESQPLHAILIRKNARYQFFQYGQ